MSDTFTSTDAWDPTGPPMLAEPDPYWIEFGAHVEVLVSTALMHDSCGVEHIGATAIPGSPARPIADLALRIAPHARTQDIIDRLTETGWACHGEDPTIGGLLFASVDGPYQALLRAVGHDDPRWQRWLTIRDTLHNNPHVAAAYTAVKRASIGTSRYATAKSDFLATITADTGSGEGPSPVVRRVRGLLIAPTGEVLLIRRTKPHQPIHWVMPGGGIEAGDGSLEATALREIAEETGGVPRLHRLVHVADVVGHLHAIFLACMPAWNPAERTGPEFTDPDQPKGRYDLETLPLEDPAFTDGHVWPVPTARWAAAVAAAGTDLFEVPDLRDSQTIAWGPRDWGPAVACEACDRRAGAR